MDMKRHDFESSIKCSDSYAKLIYMHGEKLFIFDDGKYKIAAMQLAWEIYCDRHDEIEGLKTQLSLQRQRVKAFEDELTNSRNYGDELQKRVDKALELMQKPVIVGEPSNYVCARFKELEQSLKGEGTLNLNIDEKGECRHFSTTMFFNGKAECFHCDAVVNEDREIIGKQSKGFCWPAKEGDQ